MARKREKRNVFRILVGKPAGKSHLKHLGVDWSIILKQISKTGDGNV
jgi:hypothetical protein